MKKKSSDLMTKKSRLLTLAALAFVLCTGLISSLWRRGLLRERNDTHLRVARPTDHLPEVVKFYRDGLGLEMFSSFFSDKGFEGVILGRKSSPSRLEFTTSMVTRSAGRLLRIIFWCSIYPTRPNGRARWKKWRSMATAGQVFQPLVGRWG